MPHGSASPQLKDSSVCRPGVSADRISTWPAVAVARFTCREAVLPTALNDSWISRGRPNASARCPGSTRGEMPPFSATSPRSASVARSVIHGCVGAEIDR